ncbi:leucyl/phenylalanyl-tRNA--protein transferase [Flexivirga caeni]|uniref:Leucyl/phenylalanyl-tRNA--protein transferase n=1 Tax=Flexivirga caeni TaxID=2294115 RepID=A0A3M9MFX2_9MICO|nr:leucyl/phenylalanyl-tRNA--protein transferase [Flexivirga caeni]RNI24394.1 leucyl/phenylalanyl-tRNA--protein transferase [Flexivirga caeni]
MPVEPAPSRWNLDEQRQEDATQDLIAVGADLEPGTLLAAYRSGMFPMGIGDDGRRPIGWWSPVRRGVLLPGDFHVSRSLRRSRHRYRVTIDEAFADVVAACADPGRSGRWITAEVQTAYLHLHRLGWAHSVETWDPAGRLAGGLYGVCAGGLFAAESMFHRATDAGKVAVWALTELVFADGDHRRLIDVQWQTDHLATLGVREIARTDYLRRVVAAVGAPLPDCWSD